MSTVPVEAGFSRAGRPFESIPLSDFRALDGASSSLSGDDGANAAGFRTVVVAERLSGPAGAEAPPCQSTRSFNMAPADW